MSINQQLIAFVALFSTACFAFLAATNPVFRSNTLGVPGRLIEKRWGGSRKLAPIYGALAVAMLGAIAMAIQSLIK